jgi:hypothetical protein
LAEDGPFTIERLGPAAEGGPERLRLRLKQGILEAEVWIDRTTWLPIVLKRRWLGAEQSWEFTDYRPVLGFTLPHRLVHRIGGQADTFDVQTVREAPAEAGNPYVLPRARPADTRFDPALSPRVDLKQVPSGHLFVRPRVNGRDVGWFALDTGSGAGMTVSPAAADALHLPRFGKAFGGGAGKLLESAFRQGDTFELGPVRIGHSVYLELPGEFVTAMRQAFGLDLTGTCGYELFSRAVVEFDRKEGTLALFDPETYRLEAWTWEALALNRRIPCVRCRFEGDRERLFQLDTGAGKALLLHAPAVEELKLLEARPTAPAPLAGVGGAVPARAGQLAWFSVGGHRFSDVPALFVVAREGALCDPYAAGTFGGDFLMPFKTVFDYPHRLIAFVPRQAGT